jgi:carbon starvation protein CstA
VRTRATSATAALAEGTLALSALLIAVTAFGSDAEWQQHYAAAPNAGDFPLALQFYVEQYAKHAAALGLGIDFARQLAVVVVAGLALAAVEAGARTLRHLWAELIPPPAPGVTNGRRYDERTRLWWTLGACALIALYDGRGFGGIALWPLLAMASLWLGACGFGVMALALRESQRSIALAWALAGTVAALAAWTSTSQLLAWWRAGEWLLVGGAVAVLLLAVALLAGIVRGGLGAIPTGGSNT